MALTLHPDLLRKIVIKQLRQNLRGLTKIYYLPNKKKITEKSEDWDRQR